MIIDYYFLIYFFYFNFQIWDLRKLTHVHCYKLEKPASSLDISERGLVGIGMGRNIQVLRHAFINPMDVTYLNHEIRTPNAALSAGAGATAATKALLSKVSITNVEFRPLEDVLCAGHSHGVSAIIVPGSGEPNFDSYENNPFINARQRREAEVQNLLNKLSPDMIGLDNTLIGTVEKDQKTLQNDHNQLFYGANKEEAEKKVSSYYFHLIFATLIYLFYSLFLGKEPQERQK